VLGVEQLLGEIKLVLLLLLLLNVFSLSLLLLSEEGSGFEQLMEVVVRVLVLEHVDL